MLMIAALSYVFEIFATLKIIMSSLRENTPIDVLVYGPKQPLLQPELRVSRSKPEDFFKFPNT